MVKFQIRIQRGTGETLAKAQGIGVCQLVYEKEYEEGDCILLESSETNCCLELMLDDVLGSELVYLTNSVYCYKIPFGEKRISYSPKAFSGACHILKVRELFPEERGNYYNLARNVYDQHGEPGLYPHAHANVETRGESVFAARNAIDGNSANHSHGAWPFESWGINQQDDAWLQLEFGRKIRAGRIVLYTRADFPHDNWWKQVRLEFSDGSFFVCQMEKTDKAHEIVFPEKSFSWLRLCELIKSEDPSPFPALSQIEVYGKCEDERC